MEYVMSVLELVSYVAVLATLAIVVWQVWASLKKFEASIKEQDAARKSKVGNVYNSLEATVKNLTELQQKAAKYDEEVSRGQQLEAAYAKRDMEFKAEQAKTAKLEAERGNLTRERETLKGELGSTNQARVTLADKLQRLALCLPTEPLDDVYRAVIGRCPISEPRQAGLQYVFSRLSVLFATAALEGIPADDKEVLASNAFSAFDEALYARFKDDESLLKAMRACLSEVLQPRLTGLLRFRWPVPGDPLNAKEHRQKEENGLGVIKEVKTATLFTHSGTLISKAIIMT